MNYCESSKHSHSFSVRRLPLLFLLLQIKNNIDAIKNATHSEKKMKAMVRRKFCWGRKWNINQYLTVYF